MPDKKEDKKSFESWRSKTLPAYIDRNPSISYFNYGESEGKKA